MTTSTTEIRSPEPPSSGPDPDSRTHDAVAAGIGAIALALLIGARWLVDTSGPDPFYKGPLIFPLIALALTALGGVPAAVRLLSNRGGNSWFIDGHGVPWNAIGVFLLVCFFPAAIGFAGLGVAVCVFVFAGLMVGGFRNPLRAALIAVLLTACLHLAFITFLDIWFPTPTLVEWFDG